MIYRHFAESDFSETDGYFKYERGDNTIYPPELWESNDSFRARLNLFRAGCWACVNKSNEVVGYMFSHPYLKGHIVPLNCEDFQLPAHPDCYYIHDIAVLKEYRGRGIAKRFLEIAIRVALACGFDEIRGVSVLGTHTYWHKHGFTDVADIHYAGQAKVIVLDLSTCYTIGRKDEAQVQDERPLEEHREPCDDASVP
jgi:GNAT superfamily N-acetyltransferase